MKITKNSRIFLIMAFLLVPILLFGIIIYSLKLYLPKVPIEGVTRKQAYEVIFNEHNSLQFLINQSGYNWYLYQGNQAGGKMELIKQFNTLGMKFVEQMGSGYIFNTVDEKEQIIVESQMWTGNYIIYQVPDEVKF